MERIYQRKEGGIWWAEWYSTDGKRHLQSTRCTDKRAAAVWLRNQERRTQTDRALPADAPPLGILEAIGKMLDADPNLSPWTIRMYTHRGGQLSRLLPGSVNAIDEPAVLGFIKTRVEEGAARETIRKELVTLRRALETAKKQGFFLGSVEATIPKFTVSYVPRKRWLSREELEMLLRQLPPHRQRWVMVAVYTGGRLSEVEGLRWEQIDFDTRRVHIAGTKTLGADRMIPLPEALAEYLEPYKAAEETGPIVKPWGKVVRDLKLACERANVPKASPNDLRRTYASWLKQAGVDSFTVAQLLGHSTSRMVELTYGRLDFAALETAVDKLKVKARTMKALKGGKGSDE